MAKVIKKLLPQPPATEDDLLRWSHGVMEILHGLLEWEDKVAPYADHGLLSGLDDVADHPGYLLISGGRALAGAWNMGDYALTNVNIDTGDIAVAVANTEWDGAYAHSIDNSQAHSDYLLNNASDESSGTITAAGFTTAGEVNAEQLTSTDDITMQGGLLALGDVSEGGVTISFTAGLAGSPVTRNIEFDPLYDQFNLTTALLRCRNLIIGIGAAGVDYTLTFHGESDSCVQTYDEDNNILNFGDTAIYTTGSITTTGIGTFGSVTDGTLTIDTGNITGMGNITGTDVDISAGTGDFSTSGTLGAGAATVTSLDAGSGAIQTTGIGTDASHVVTDAQDGLDVALYLRNTAAIGSIDETVSIQAQTAPGNHDMGKIVFGRLDAYGDSSRESFIDFYTARPPDSGDTLALRIDGYQNFDFQANELKTGGDIRIDTDTGLFKSGLALTDYTFGWNGSNAVHTITAGTFIFTGGNLVTDGITLSNGEQILNTTDDMIDFVGAGGTNNQTFRIGLDDASGPILSTTTGNRIQVTDMLYVIATDSDYGRLSYLRKTNYDCSGGYSQAATYVEGYETTAGARSLIGLDFQIRAAHSTGTQSGSLYGIKGLSQNRATGGAVTGKLGGAYFEVIQYSDIACGDMVGATSHLWAYPSKTGAVANMIGFWVYPINAEDVALTNAYGLKIDSFIVDAGSIDTAYGVWVSDQTAASTNYGLVVDSDTIGLTLGAAQDVTLLGSSSGFNFGGNIILTDLDLVLGTTAGTKIGTATGQKIGFWNTTPVIQPAHVGDPAGGATQDAEARTAINAINAAMATMGLTAAA